MASPAGRRLNPESWSPVYQTKIRASLEPREERFLLPKNERALRPKALNLPSRYPPPSSRKESLEYSYESPPEPQIVDTATPGTWPRRQSNLNRAKSTSSRQSEFSLGIIDLYMREPTPSLCSPKLPEPPLQPDPAIEQFDFGLPATPTLPSRASKDIPQSLIPISPPSNPITRPVGGPKGYSLFPVIKEATPPPRHPTISLVDPLTPTPTQQPSPTYRPRKESLTSSRTDSIASRKLIPLRILSSSESTPSNTNQSRTVSAASTYHSHNISYRSPPQQSRWSDESTITSTPRAPRTSFSSILSPTQQQFSFFEDDDDEDVPLRRKFTWKKSLSSSTSGSYDEGRKERGSVVRWLFCGCGGRR